MRRITMKILITLIFLNGGLASKLPSNFIVCRKADPNLNKCVKQAIESALPKLVNGIKELELPPLQPLVIPSATIHGGTGPVHVTQKFKNFKINNIANTKVSKYEAVITSAEYTAEMQMISPEYRIQADYDFNGRVLLLPIVGKGKCNITLENVVMDSHLYGRLIDKKGKKYLNLTTFDIKLFPEHVTFHFGNLFNGNKLLGDRMNDILNENWKDVFNDVKLGYEEVLGTVFKNYVRIIYNKVAWNDLYTL